MPETYGETSNEGKWGGSGKRPGDLSEQGAGLNPVTGERRKEGRKVGWEES